LAFTENKRVNVILELDVSVVVLIAGLVALSRDKVGATHYHFHFDHFDLLVVERYQLMHNCHLVQRLDGLTAELHRGTTMRMSGHNDVKRL
jgi:hypothetical protein